MKTDDLLALLAADAGSARPVGPAIVAAWLVPVLLAGTLFLALIGVRADLADALMTVPTIWKWLLPATVAASGVALTLALARPDARIGLRPAALLVVCAIALWLVTGQLLALPAADWRAAVLGHTHLICLSSISAISLPALLATLFALRRGATLRPRLAGLAAGLACGGGATVLYALHCNEDDPLFFVTWYGTAILFVGLVGALLGPRLLRW
jgi:hypothetical protein